MGFETFLQAKARLTAVLEATSASAGDAIEKAFCALLHALTHQGKVLICGNGGSAASAQHFSAELTGRYKKERGALPGIALSTDTSALTAIGNDYGYDQVFARQVDALGRHGDVLIGISTSGTSKNVVTAITMAAERQMKTVLLTGESGPHVLSALPDTTIVVAVPSREIARIQEVHDLIIHSWCEELDKHFPLT